MNTTNLIFLIALVMPTLSWTEEEKVPHCDSKCVALTQRLSRLDCSIAISEAAKFLSDGHTIVLAIPMDMPRIRSKVTALKAGLKTHEKIMLDCLTKHRDQPKFSDAMSAFMKANFAVEKLSEAADMPKQAQEMLIAEYAQAVKIITNLKSNIQLPPTSKEIK